MRLYDPKQDKKVSKRRKRMDSSLDRFPIYLEIKSRLENGGLEEGEQVGIVLEKADLPLVGTKHPERNLTDNLRRLIQAYDLKDHSVKKVFTENENWLVFIQRAKRKKEKEPDTLHRPARSA